ncbi:unnamed protein product [Sphagnum compactum]
MAEQEEMGGIARGRTGWQQRRAWLSLHRRPTRFNALDADLGTLQRLPRLIGHGNTLELALTGRKYWGSEAKSLGLVQDVYDSIAEMLAAVETLAKQIASKSPLAVVGTKVVLLKSCDLTVA